MLLQSEHIEIRNRMENKLLKLNAKFLLLLFQEVLLVERDFMLDDIF